MSDIPVCPVTGFLCRRLCQVACTHPLELRSDTSGTASPPPPASGPLPQSSGQ